jgi:deoxyribodipyrimidine photo-lyase
VELALPRPGRSFDASYEMAAKPAINVVWYKATDLRLHDHECTALAHADGLPVLHLFIFDPFWWRALPLTGHSKTGPIRTQFLLECLDDLNTSLAGHGQQLCFASGASAHIFEQLCQVFSVRKAFAFSEVCSEELTIERSVARALHAGGGALVLRWGFTLYHLDDVSALVDPRRAHSYRTYSAFRRPVQEQSSVRAESSAPRSWQPSPSATPGFICSQPPSVAELCGVDAPRADDRAPVRWVGGERAALAWLHDYVWTREGVPSRQRPPAAASLARR